MSADWRLPIDGPTIAPVDLLTALWGSTGMFHSLCWIDSLGEIHVEIHDDPAELAASAERLSDVNTYYGAHAMGRRPRRGHRGVALDVTGISALVGDVDWLDTLRHKDDDLPTRAEVVARLDRLGELTPPILVFTGGGVQPIWLLDHMVDHATGMELQVRLDARLLELGLTNDRGDAASILRMLGSNNVKGGECVEVVARGDLSRRFGVERLGKILPPATCPPHIATSSTRHTAGPTTDGQRQLVDHLLEHHGARNVRGQRDGSVLLTRPGADHHPGPSAHVIVGTEGDAVVSVFSRTWLPIGPPADDVRVKSRSWVLHNGELIHPGAKTERELEDMINAGADDDDDEHQDDGDGSSSTSSSSPSLLGKSGLRALTALQAVLAAGPIRPGQDGQLWHYRNGVYLPAGDVEARRRLLALLGQNYRPTHRATVVELLGTRPTFLTNDPPERWINVTNGLLDWRTGELLAHTPDVATTYQLSVPWNPAATCPTVDAWLDDILDPSVTELVWEVIGASVYADLAFHRAVMLYGLGRNGKGTLLRLIGRLVGEVHAAAVTLQALAEDRFIAAELYGKVVNLAGDLDARQIKRTDLFKMATGGDLIQAQRKFGHPFTFRNRALMVFSANEIPKALDNSPGFHSRWVVVPFDQRTLKPDEEDKTLEPRMHAELEGVLVKAVAGLRRAMAAGGFTMPPIVADATAQYRRLSDPICRFVDEVLDVTGEWHDTISRAGIVDAFDRWRSANNLGTISPKQLWADLVVADPRIDTGVTEDNPNGHRINRERVVRGVRGLQWQVW